MSKDPVERETGAEDQARREFLKKAGRFAAATPPAVSLLLATTMNSSAVAASGGTRPGWGFGDKNHEHSGPPGQEGRQKG
jgi:hypothetical protein